MSNSYFEIVDYSKMAALRSEMVRNADLICNAATDTEKRVNVLIETTDLNGHTANRIKDYLSVTHVVILALIKEIVIRLDQKWSQYFNVYLKFGFYEQKLFVFKYNLSIIDIYITYYLFF